MSDDVTITVRVNNQTAAGFRDVNGQLRTLDGRFASTAGSMRRSGDGITKSLVDIRASLLSLAPAAVPVAASLAPIVTQAGAAGLALTAFGAAVIPQIGNLKSAADAQGKYSAAVAKYGANSKQAIQAQQQASAAFANMPRATQQASAAYQVMQDKFANFSKSTASFTMAPVEHSFLLLGQILPKLAPMAESTGTQLDRLVKVAAGGVNSSGFDALSKKVSDYANNSLKKAVDGTIHFARVLSEGHMSGPMAQFFDYARQQGPAVKELLSNLASATGNIVEGAAQAGPGLLSIVNALAKMAAAVPPELIGNLMQVYAAFKLIKLAGAGIAAVGGGIASLAGKVAALQAASAAAGGGLAGLKAAFLGLGTAAKATVVVAGITLLAVALSKLSDIGKKAPPDVDRMTTSLGNLGRTGKVSGEALRSYGKDLGGLADSLRTLSRPSNLDKTQQFLTSLVGMDSTPVKEAKQNLDAVDKALASMVKGGKADLAKAAFEDIAKAMEKQGMSSKELKSKLNDYKSALADQALEAKLTAESQGLFGQAAQETQAKLDAQKASADGLRQSLQALNDVNRQGLGGMIGFESAIDAAAEAAKKNAGALTMTHGQLNLNSQKARDAATALQDLADKTDSAAASQREAGASWETVNGVYSRGRSELVKQAQAMGLTKAQAQALADQILKIPSSKSMKLDMRTEDAVTGLNNVIAAMRKTPSSKSVTVKALTSDAVSTLRDLGFKVTKLPDGRFKVTASTKSAKDALAAVQRARDALRDKSITLSARDRASKIARDIRAAIDSVRSKTVTLTTVRHTAGVEGTAGRANKNLSGFAEGGPITGGSGTQDDVPILAMGGEFMVNKRSAQKHRSLLEAINEDKLPKFAKGGSVTKAEKQARSAATSDLTISHFGTMAGYQRSEFRSALAKPDSVSSLVDALNQWRGIIKAATRGGQERTLLRALDSSGRKLLSWEKQLTKVSASLEKAKDKLNSLKDAASQLADSVKSGILSSSNITKAAGADSGQVTINTIMSQMAGDAAKAQGFSTMLASLKKKGLDKGLIQDIANAGVEGGGLETAQALAGASASQIKDLNKLRIQQVSAAGAAGKTAADAMYAASIKAQEKTVKDLTNSQNKLKTSMDRLAASMEKMIERAFAKKAAGGIVGAAASGGLRGGLTWVGEHEPELLDLPVGSRVWSGPDSRRKLAAAQAPWASMLNTPRRSPMAAQTTAGAAAGQPMVVQLVIAGRQLGEVVIDPLRRSIHSRGGDVQAVLGKGGI